MLNNKQVYLNMYTKTWGRDSHGLYDYESVQTKDLNVVLEDNQIITRKKHDIKIVKSQSEITDDEVLLTLRHEPSNINDDYYYRQQVYHRQSSSNCNAANREEHYRTF